MKIAAAAAFAAVLAALSTASAQQRLERAVEQPILKRSLNWFGYVGGDDITEACKPGGRDRMRIVYNALWEEQVRTYEIVLQPDGTAGITFGVLADQGQVASLAIGGASDLTNPWKMRKAQRLLNASETAELASLLEASAAFGPARDGLRLPDNDFWWTVVSCRKGIWGFQAYHHPTDGFANVKFAEKLFAWDSVPVKVNRPRKLEPAQFRRDPSANPGRDRSNRWVLVVGKEGLRPR